MKSTQFILCILCIFLFIIPISVLYSLTETDFSADHSDTHYRDFPFNESFDGTTFPPIGWLNFRVQGSGTPGTWNRQTSGTIPTCSPHTGTAMARFYCGNYAYGTQGALVTPAIDLPNNQCRVKFWMFRDSSYPNGIYGNEMISVWLNSSPSLTGADSLGVIHRRIDLFPTETNDGWHMYVMNFPLTSSGTQYVIFKAVSCRGANMYIDDVTVEQQTVGLPDTPTMLSPANGAMHQLNFVSLKWQNVGSGPMVHGYRLSVGTDNPPTNLMNNVEIGTATYYNVELQYNTTYYWKVVSHNTSGDAANCPVWYFTTKSNPAFSSFPYTQNFDTVTSPELPPDWATYLECGNSTPTISTNTALPASSPNQVQLSAGSDVTARLILISPPIPDIDLTRIRFSARSHSNTSVTVGTMENPILYSTFTPYQTIPLNGIYHEYVVPLTNYQGNAHYLGFTFHPANEYDRIDLDDIALQINPSGSYIETNLGAIAMGEIHNSSSTTREILITNTGYANLTFTIAPSTNITTNLIGMQTLAPDSSRICLVTALPENLGAFARSLSIQSNDTLHPTVTIPITATVLPSLPSGMIELGYDNVTSTCLPSEPYWEYSLSQTIYQQPELNHSNCCIASLSYEYNGAWAIEDTVQIYLGHTAKTHFNSTTDWVPIDELTLAYWGPMSMPQTEGWVNVTLQTPFVYDNVHNLVVCVNKLNNPHNFDCDFYATESLSDRSLWQIAGLTPIPLTNLPEGYLRADIPNTRIQFLQLAQSPNCVIAPTSIDFGNQNIEAASQTEDVLIRNEGFGQLIITQSPLLQGANASDFFLTDTNTYPITLTNGQSITVTVGFDPQSTGNKRASLSITDNIASLTPDPGTDRQVHNVPLYGNCYDSYYHDFPLIDGFENTNFPSSSWLVTDSANPAFGWRRRTTVGNAHTGNAYAVVGVGGGDHWLISPRFRVADNCNQLSFWLNNSTDVADSFATSRWEYLEVLVSTTTTDTTAFDTLLLHYNNAMIPETYQEHTLDLSAYTDSVICIGFKRHSNNAKYVYLDDLTIDSAGGTDNADETAACPVDVQLHNYPNPFHPRTSIQFLLKQCATVELVIYNTKGQKIRSLLNESRPAGQHAISWDGRDDVGHTVACGIYLCSIKTGSTSQTRKMVMLK